MSIFLFFEILSKWKLTDIGNIESFSITIFGIGVTLFTVLYSFISMKYEEIFNLRNKIINSTASVEEQAQYKIAIRYVCRQRRINRYLIFICVFSFVLYLLCKVNTFFLCDDLFFQGLLALFYIILVLAVCVMMVWILIEYLRLIRQ